MVDESPDMMTDEQKNKKLAEGIRELLIERINLKTLNASEMKVALELLEKMGYRYVSAPSTKPGGSRPLPPLDNDEDDVVTLTNGITVRQAR